MADMMQRRNSPLVRTVLVVAGLGSIVYLIYLNHDLNTRLKNTDDRAERFRRSHESLSAQLQVMFDHKSRLEKSLLQEKLEHKKRLDDLTAAKEELEKKSEAERDEMGKRLTAFGKDKKMLKSQHEDLKLDYEKLQQENDKLKADLENLKAEDNREYQLMKTQKDLELSSLRDTVANQVKDLDKLRNSLQQCQAENKNIQALRNTALTNITKLQEDITKLKTESQASNRTVSNLQVINNQLQANQVQHQQLINSLQQTNQRLVQKAQLAQQNDQQHLQVGQPVFQGQRQQNGAVVMDQGQPIGGAAANQNPIPGVGGVNGQPNQAKGDMKPEVPDAIDQGQVLQIKPADLGGKKPVGYEHDKDRGGGQAPEDGNKAGAPIHRQEEEEQQHQVQPPNLKFQKFDSGGLNHLNPLEKHLEADQVEEDKNAQNGHDNSIHNQGPVGLQVQEPVLGGGPKDAGEYHDLGGPNDAGEHRGVGERRGEGGFDKEEDEEEEDEAQLAQPNFARDQFMQNAHMNKQLIARNDGNVDEDGQDGGVQVDKDNYYEEEEEVEDEEDAEDVQHPADFGLRNQRGREM